MTPTIAAVIPINAIMIGNNVLLKNAVIFDKFPNGFNKPPNDLPNIIV